MIAPWAVIGAVSGLIAGSFIATLVVRWPAGRSMAGRSACDACGRQLTLRDLVPIVSWATARGACRSCRAPINWRHPAVEMIAAMIGLAAMLAQPGLEGFAGALFGWQLLALAALDVDHFWLPDRLTFLLAASGVAFAVSGLGAGFGVGVTLSESLIGGVAGFVSLAAIAWGYRRVRGRDGMGGGDPKLLGAIGCWLGWQSLPAVMIGASICGLAAAVAMQVSGRQVAATTRLPLGTLMALAAFAVWLALSQR